MAAAPVKTSVTELPESRVRVEAEVPAAEVEKRVERAARALGREMRVPGFRKGKVPPPVVIRRVGRGAVLDEAVREGLTSWYVDAIGDAGIVPVGDPQLDLGDLPAAGEPLTFSIEIGVRPTARLGAYRGLEVARRVAAVDEDRIDEGIERLRERLAKLENVDRPAGPGDFLVVDYLGRLGGGPDGEADGPFEGGEGRDQLLELGSGRLVPGFEDALVGASGGEERMVEVTFPEDYGADHLAGRPATFAVTVKEVKAKVLPELDDELAADAAGLDTLAELRDDVAGRLRETEEGAIEGEFREAVLDAAVSEAEVDVPEALVDARARELWEHTLSTLGRQGISREAYLRISGRTEEEILGEARPEAEQALKREAVLAAIVAVEGIDPTDEDLEAALEHPAHAGPAGGSAEKSTPGELLARLRDAGRLDGLRDDVATRQALALLAREATPISIEHAHARDKLWTPGREAPAGEGGEPAEAPAGPLWTPGS